MARTTTTADTSGKSGRTIISRTCPVQMTGEDAPWAPPRLQPTRPTEPLPMRLKVPQPPRPPEANSAAANAPISAGESLEEIAARRPADVSRVVQAMLSADASPSDEAPPDETLPSGLRRVATLIIGLGPRLASRVLEHCSHQQVERIAKAVQQTESVTAREAREVFDQARDDLVSGNYNLEGGWVAARTLLYRTLGSNARMALDRLLEADADAEDIDILRQMAPGQAVSYLGREHPQTIALVLAQMDPEWAAGVLNGFSPELKTEVVDRIAELDTIPARVLFDLRSAVKYEVSALLSGRLRKVGGPDVAEGIRRHLTPATESSSEEATS